MTFRERRDRRRRRFYERLTRFRAVNAVALLALGLTLGAALLERLVEPQTFSSFGDACWWAIVTVSTTGFGDVVPHTVAGRVVAVAIMIASLAWVPAVTAIVITLHTCTHPARRAPRATHNARGHRPAPRPDRAPRRAVTSGRRSTRRARGRGPLL
jgi:voltage-gated potassium channel